MNEDVKALWVEALESGLTQIEGRLQDDGGFCCLGVLCDLAVKAGVIGEPKSWGSSNVRGFPSLAGTEQFYYEEALLPEEVVEWAGLTNRNPVVKSERGFMSLSALNDGGKPFITIAQLIKDQL